MRLRIKKIGNSKKQHTQMRLGIKEIEIQKKKRKKRREKLNNRN